MKMSKVGRKVMVEANRVQGMSRSIDQWRNMVPSAVTNGSVAQVEYALTDAKTDIEALWGAGFVIAEKDAEIDALRKELHLMKSAGIIEVSVRNPSVSDYMNHWEKRAESAEARVAELEKALEPFAKVAQVFDDARPPSPNEDEHTVYAWATMATGDVEITVGHFRAARRAITK